MRKNITQSGSGNTFTTLKKSNNGIVIFLTYLLIIMAPNKVSAVNYSIDDYDGQTIAACSGSFFDSGDAGNNYGDNEDYSVSISSSNSTPIRVEFTSWDVEDHNTCDWDYLSIYDGTDASATLIGTYCTSSPGTVQSTNAANTLHFVWHSDGNYTESGWEATISCTSAPLLPQAKIQGMYISNCVNQPLQDIATIDVTLNWTNPTTDTILLNLAGKDEIVVIAGETAPLVVQYMIEADGSTGNYISSRFSDGAGLVSDTYNAPSPCSNDLISCDILYINGSDKPADGDAWDQGIRAYLQSNTTGTLTNAYAIPVGFGYGLYDPNNTSGSPLSINLNDYDLVVISSTTQGTISNDLMNDLKTTEAGILNFNYLILDDLGMASTQGTYSFQDWSYIDNDNSIGVQNFDNDVNPTYLEVITGGNYHNNADVFLWMNQGDYNNGNNGVFFAYSDTDVLPGIASHGSRVHLGYHPNGFYSNSSNGGAYPTPQSAWFSPIKHLTIDAKSYFDMAIVRASENCDAVNEYSCNTTLIYDADLESGLQFWGDYGNTTVTNDAYTGDSAILVSTPSGGQGGFGQSIEAEAGVTYTLEAYAKKTGSERAFIEIIFYNQNWSNIGNVQEDIIGNTYSLYSVSGVAPVGTAYVNVIGWKEWGNGSATFDSYCLSANAPYSCASTMITNPEFENDFNSWWNSPSTSITDDAYMSSKAARKEYGEGGFGQYAPAVEGNTYMISGYLKKSDWPTNGALGLKFYDLNYVLLSEDYVDINTIDYKQFTVSNTAPVNTEYMEVVVWKNTESGSITADGFCFTEINPTISLDNIVVGSCINQPLEDVATIDVTLSWSQPSSDIIVVAFGSKEEYVDISNVTSPITRQFIVSADGSANNTVTVSFYGNDVVTSSSSYNAPNACSNDEISCDILYIGGANKYADGRPFDLGFVQYLDKINGSSSLTPTFAKSDASGYGLYDFDDETTLLNIDLNDYELIVVSPSSNWGVANDLVDALKTYSGGILNMNREIADALGMATYDGGIAYQDFLYINDNDSEVIYNYDNINPTFDEIFSEIQDYGSADAYLWSNSGMQSYGAKSAFHHYESTDVLPNIASHGPRTYLGYFMEGIYSNQENGGVIPHGSVAGFFNPVHHLTLVGKDYLDQAILLAASECVAPTTINIDNAVVSACIDQPLVDVATLDVTLSWENPSTNIIEVSLGDKVEYVNISGETSPLTVQFVVEADGSTNNSVTANFNGDNLTSSSSYDAPVACSNDSITCSVLYLRGANKQEDGEPFDLGFANYLDKVNGPSNVTVAFAKSDANGYGLYNSNDINTPLIIDINDYELIVISPSTNWILASDLVNDLKTYNGGILNMNRGLAPDLGMTSGNAWVNVQDNAYIDNNNSIVIYNYDNINPTYDEIVSIGDYDNTTADAYLWDSEWNASSGINGIMFHYEETDALPNIAFHGPRTYLGYFMEGLYSNQSNGGSLPAPSANLFDPVKHLTLEGKDYFDQAIVLASQTCSNCPTPIVSGIDAENTSCATEEVLFTASPAVDGALYSWTFEGDATPSTSTNPSETVEWATPGVKNVTLIVTKDGCEEVYTHSINITEAVFADAGPDRNICRGGSTQLGASPSGNAAATYLWTPNLFLNDNTVANPIATPPVTTTYTLYVTQNGCTKTAEVTVTVDVSLNPTVEAGFESTICNTSNESVELGADADPDVVLYQWSTSSGDIAGANDSYYIAQPAVPTMYYVTGTTIDGCYATDSVYVNVITCTEICNDGIDNDGDGQIDCKDGDCDYVPGCIPENFHADPTTTAQRYDRWIFADEVNIDFRQGLPDEEDNNPSMSTTESSNTFTGPNGEMFFYTDGVNVYNRNGNVMENGYNIGGSNGVVNSSVSFQSPQHDDKMYLFVTANVNDEGGNPLTTTASYNLINMNEGSGLGSVVEKLQPIEGTSEGLTSIPHHNGRDIWVITADKNSSTVYSTLVNKESGVQTSVGYTLPLGSPNGFPQEINIIGNGQHDMLAIGCYFDKVLVLYDFDNVTGAISNMRELPIQEKVYGLEFSPNGQYLYVSSYSDSSLFQLTINDTPAPAWRTSNGSETVERAALTPAQIIASRVDISTGLGNYGHLQIGPDGRIYCPVAGVSVGAIINPNGHAATSGWSASVLDVPGARITGALPNFMNGGCFRTAFLLPVEMAFFDVTAHGNDAHLDWQTLSEVNNDYFLIQRSTDAFSWENIGEVDGSGNTISPVDYSFIDYSLPAGVYYYRLMQVDYDGIFDYSEIKSVEIFGNGEVTVKPIQITPNPVRPDSYLSISGGNNDKLHVKIISVNGAVVYDNVPTNRSLELAELSLAAGMYVIEVKDGNETYIEKLVVQ